MHTIRTGYPSGNPEAVVRRIDVDNKKEEELQNPFSDVREYSYKGVRYPVKNHYPTKYRTYENEQGEQVIYPHLLMVHGVASDASYFDGFGANMARLGIASSAIELPRFTSRARSSQSLLSWQVGAVAHTSELLKETASADRDVILVGHSRGAIIATKAATELYDNEFYRSKGLILLAPAGIDKIAEGKLYKGVPLLGPLVVNNLVSGFQEGNRLIPNARMLGRVILRNIPQTLIEVKQAMNEVVTEDFKQMPETDIFIPFAEEDEFIKYADLYKVALKNKNIAVVTVESSHMLDSPRYKDVISLADPRLLTGQVLSFMQAQIEKYSPKSIHAESGSYYRLSPFNLQLHMARLASQSEHGVS